MKLQCAFASGAGVHKRVYIKHADAIQLWSRAGIVWYLYMQGFCLWCFGAFYSWNQNVLGSCLSQMTPMIC